MRQKEWFTLPQHQETLKAAVAEAHRNLAQIASADGRGGVRDDETRRELADIDWDDDSEPVV